VAKEGTIVVVPSSVGDVAGMVTQAMAIFGGVSKDAKTPFVASTAATSVNSNGTKSIDFPIQKE
jgi:hypothetical protein